LHQPQRNITLGNFVGRQDEGGGGDVDLGYMCTVVS
jgi:hypothetical protein